MDGSRFLAKPFTPSLVADVIRDLMAADAHPVPMQDTPVDVCRPI